MKSFMLKPGKWFVSRKWYSPFAKKVDKNNLEEYEKVKQLDVEGFSFFTWAMLLFMITMLILYV